MYAKGEQGQKAGRASPQGDDVQDVEFEEVK